MVIEPAAAGFRAGNEPLAGCFVEVLADVGFAVLMLRLGIGEELLEIVLARDVGLGRAAKHVGEADERLAGRERPNGSVPLTGAVAVGAKFRVSALGRREAIGSAKAGVVFDL